MSGVIPDLSLPNRAGDKSPSEQDDAAPQRAPRDAATLIDRWGLWIAPLLIAGLAGLLALYHRSLDLENQVRQQRSALS